MAGFADIFKVVAQIGQVGVQIAAHEAARRDEVREAQQARGQRAARGIGAPKPSAKCCLKLAAKRGGLQWRSGS